jgi:hypothetical protein
VAAQGHLLVARSAAAADTCTNAQDTITTISRSGAVLPMQQWRPFSYKRILRSTGVKLGYPVSMVE